MPINQAINNTQHIYDLVALCACKRVRYAVLCPGSRCAPLLIGFGKHPKIQTVSVTDERSAGFIGLGLAQQSNTPVVLVCTSGTAGQNFAPAVTEAFYQNVPLIVLTADRPPEWIDQWDGQTIHQQSLYGNHVRARMEFQARPEALDQAEALLDQAVTPVAGPVHLNIPIRKPFYPHRLDEVCFPTLNATPPSRLAVNITEQHWQSLEGILKTAGKVLLIAGQQKLDQALHATITRLGVPLLGDVISNIHPVGNTLQPADVFFDLNEDNLRPDFLITIGRSVISENLKQYFRQHKAAIHWHIGLGMTGDPFQSLTESIQADPHDFFQECLNRGLSLQDQSGWQDYLQRRNEQVRSHIVNCIQNGSLNQFAVIKQILNSLSKNKNALHLGNSLPVRVANYIALNPSGPEVWSNRGTSGIDGTLSTAVGHALAQPDWRHTLIIGDLAFFYDRNGLWLNQDLPVNLKIIVLNNAGGGIFDVLPGPADQEELLELFTTPHRRSVKLAAQEFCLDYFCAHSLAELNKILITFPALEKPAIMEIPLRSEEDKRVFRQLKQITTQ